MKQLEVMIKEIKASITDLEKQGIYIDINIDDIEGSIKEPEEYDENPSCYVDDAMFIVDNIKDDIVSLYNKLDKLQDLIYGKDL